MLSKLENLLLKKSINELNQEHQKEERSKRRFHFLTKLFIISIIIFVFISLAIFIKNRFFQLQSNITAKDKKIEFLEDNLTSLQLQEQLFEEKEKLYNFNHEQKKDFIEKVEKNQNFLYRLVDDNPQYKGLNITRGNTELKKIALTFDLSTGQHLEVVYNYLLQYPTLKISIFLSNENPSLRTGSLINRRNRYYIKKLSDLEDRVLFGNHTWSHFNLVRSLNETSLEKRKYLPYISQKILNIEDLSEELQRVEDEFFNITGKKLSKYYRLPYGAISKKLLNIFTLLDYDKHVYWSYSQYGSLDIPDFIYKKFLYKKTKGKKVRMFVNPYYKTIPETLDFLYNWEKKNEKGMNGAIILMHLGTKRKTEQLIFSLADFIPKMFSKGYEFVTIDEILDKKEN